MTHSTLLTRCPHCETRFRVTDEQLGVAKGKVRCGNCMEVFNAIEHQQADAAVKPEPASTSPAASGIDGLDDELVFEDDPDVDAAEGHYAGTRLNFSDDELSDSFRNFDTQKQAAFDETPDDDLREQVDESWAEDMLSDDRPSTDAVSRRQIPREPAGRPPSEPVEPTMPDEPVPFELEGRSPAPRKPRTAPADPQPTPAPEPEWDEPAAAEPPPPPADEPGIRATDHLQTPYHDLGREPIALSHRQERSGFRRIVWTLVILAGLAGLVSQVVYFQFDRLSAVPELRPLYEKGCALVGCTLKPLIAIDQIQSRKLVVRTAPDDRNALVVDAEIVNQAEFEQPFPAIGLTFSNLNGDVVAQSVFEPADYLDGEARSLTMMPAGKPVHIAITIRDPGRDAVNYNIVFRPRKP